MSAITAGQMTRQAPGSARVYELDWGQALATGVTLTDKGKVEISPKDECFDLTYHELAPGNRSVLVRLSDGKANRRYRVSHRVTTSETPAQTLVQSFQVLVRE